MSTLTVGAGQQFATIAAAVAASRDGDILAIDAGTYSNDFATINTKITLEGVGGTVNLVATEAPPNGKAILTTNTDVTIRNMAFSGAEVADGNGAGIRFQGGDLVIENCLFENNQDGLLSGTVPGGTITIRNSEFADNGTGDGYTHNLYVGEIARLTIEDSYFHGAVVGHQIKSRALETTITGSRIAEGADGTGSYSIDLPLGGKAVIADNTIEQGAHSQNPVLIHFGGEGGPHPGSSLSVTGNSVVNHLDSAGAVLVWNQTDIVATIAENAVFGLTPQQIARGVAQISGLTILDAVTDQPEAEAPEVPAPTLPGTGTDQPEAEAPEVPAPTPPGTGTDQPQDEAPEVPAPTLPGTGTDQPHDEAPEVPAPTLPGTGTGTGTDQPQDEAPEVPEPTLPGTIIGLPEDEAPEVPDFLIPGRHDLPGRPPMEAPRLTAPDLRSPLEDFAQNHHSSHLWIGQDDPWG